MCIAELGAGTYIVVARDHLAVADVVADTVPFLVRVDFFFDVAGALILGLPFVVLTAL